MPMWILIVVGIVLIAAAAVVSHFLTVSNLKKNADSKIGNAESKAREIIDDAVKTAEAKKKESLLEIKEESIKNKNELEKETKERRNELQRYEKRVLSKEEALDKKADAIEKREAGFTAKEEQLKQREAKVEELGKQRVQELERISGLTSEQAKEYLLKTVEDDVKHDTAKMIKEIEAQAKEEAGSYTVAESGQIVSDSAKKQQPNVICVLLESFMDPTEINFLKMSKDPIPNFRELSDNFTSGYLTVPVVGAGTANSEFEVLTGMNLRFFGTGEYPYKTILKETDCESIASDLSAIGYGTHVVHNNGGNFYSRANAFSQFGFDTFTSKELMNIQEYTPLGSWPTDDILISETEKALDSTPDQSDFVYTITVQGHGSYPEEKIIENPEITVSGAETEEKNNQWEYYVNQIHEVDKFIKNLTDMLAERDEPTMLVLFGDHLPTMGLTDEDVKSGDIFKTQYATWNNFGLEQKDADLAAYQLLAYTTEQAGLHQGTIFTYHQAGEYDTEHPQYQNQLENLQYDILYGERYCYDGEDLYPASDLQMGVDQTHISRYHKNADGSLSIYGDHFTNWSRIYVNDEKMSTMFVSDEHVMLPSEYAADLENGDILKVCQVGSSNTIFRTTENSVTFFDASQKEAE